MLYDHFSTKLPLPHLHTDQNILLYASSLRWFLYTRFYCKKECLSDQSVLWKCTFSKQQSPFIVIYLDISMTVNVVCMSALFVFCLDVSLFMSFPLSVQPHVYLSMGPSLHLSVLFDCLKVLCVSLSISLCIYISQYESFLLLTLLFCMIVFPF